MTTARNWSGRVEMADGPVGTRGVNAKGRAFVVTGKKLPVNPLPTLPASGTHPGTGKLNCCLGRWRKPSRAKRRGAIVEDEHGWWGYCERVAGYGTPFEGKRLGRDQEPGFGRCKWHLGNAPIQLRGAKREFEQAMADRYDLRKDIEAPDALQEALEVAAGKEQTVRDLIEALVANEGPAALFKKGPDGTPRPAAIWTEHERLVRQLTEIAGNCRKLGLAQDKIDLARLQGEAIAGLLRTVIAGVLAVAGVQLDGDAQAEVNALVRRELQAVNLKAPAIEARST